MRPPTIRLDTHKVVDVLDAFFDGEPLVGERVKDDDRALLYFAWRGTRGGQGALWIDAADAELVETVRLCRSDSTMWVRARTLLARAIELHAREGEFHLERTAEVLHGRRDQQRSHRERELRPLHALVRLFTEGIWLIDAPITSTPPRQRKRAAARLAYGGRLEGPLFRVERKNRRTATVFADELRRVLRPAGGAMAPFVDVQPEALRLSSRHRNARGRCSTRGEHSRVKARSLIYARWRQGRKSAGSEVQRIRFVDLLERWCGIPVEGTHRSRRLAAMVDQLCDELDRLGLLDVDALDRTKPRDCVVCLRVPRLAEAKVQPSTPATVARADALSDATASGSASSTGPPSTS
jgi:hypothetical protein